MGKDAQTILLDLFEWYEIMHLAGLARKFNILSRRERYALYNYFGKPKMYLAKGMDEYYREFEDWQINQFNKIILRLVRELPKDFQCGSWCTACHKLSLIKDVVEKIDKNRTVDSLTYRYKEQKERWKLEFDLYKWQKECIDAWKENGKGIVKVVTGAGKTVVALEAMRIIRSKTDKVKFFIVVPSKVLLLQWQNTIQEHMKGISPGEIGLFYSDEWGDYEKDVIQIYVINSARDYLPRYNDSLREEGYKTFLIADECHRYGSEKNSKIFDTTYDWYLGLSATPERKGDWGFEEILVPNLGEVIYEYTYADALRDKIIPPFTLINYAIDLCPDERKEYERLSKKISKIYENLVEKYPELPDPSSDDYFKHINYIERTEEDEEISLYKRLLYQRRMLIHNARQRYRAVKDILEEVHEDIEGPRVLIFHELIECAERLYRMIEDTYYVEIYHSGLKDGEKRLYNFMEGFSNILITCRALDEGLDVPNVNVGIIAASTKSVRQRIQRMGRILRKAPGKNHSYIYTVYIPGIDDEIFRKKEIKKLEGVAKVINRRLS